MQRNKIITYKKEFGNIENSLNFFLEQKFSPQVKILDIGCSFGSLIYNLYKSGYKNIYGLDNNKKRILKGRKSYPKIAEKLKYYLGEKIPFKDNEFDVVVMFDVIEHIPEIKKFMQNEVHRVLKKGGIFLFQTPNKIINIPWVVFYFKSIKQLKKYHPSLQTLSSLKRLFKRIGFKDISIKKRGILTKINKNKVKKKMGSLGIVLLKISFYLPLVLYPNFWGKCKK